MRPCGGDPLREPRYGEYDGSTNLHVGITNTKGIVYNYNEAGVQREGSGWDQSISVPLVQPDMYSLLDQWDQYLEQFSAAEAWLPQRYEEYDHNCYTYALTFINCVLATQGKQTLSKNQFTERFVLPKTRRASRYITLYQEILENYFYIVDIPHQREGNHQE
ncbi:MKRN2 opposite strand protein isoform X2 [Latimeria chalumnae]|uniref:MKRN2 opposite strand protein isoform X2 n=1 Tax=Latimeria chalumnae TaxID=7897 RepID=UPI00313CBF5F